MSELTETVKMLSLEERREFQRDDRVVKEGVSRCLEVARALLNIKAKALYREEFRTFEDYMHSRGLSRQRGYQLAKFAEVEGEVSTAVDTTGMTERNARTLAEYPPEERAAAWENRTEGGRVLSPEEEADRINQIDDDELDQPPPQNARKPLTLEEANGVIKAACAKVRKALPFHPAASEITPHLSALESIAGRG